jgi:hypothetical protein
LGEAIVARKRITAARFAELMESGELHSRIIRDVAELETHLNAIIAAYFAPPARSAPFTELVLDRLSVWAKVGVVERLPFERQPRSLRHIQALKDIVLARNFVAHRHCLPPGGAPARVKPWLYLLADYPKAYDAHLRSVRHMLRSLLRTRDLARPSPRMRREE